MEQTEKQAPAAVKKKSVQDVKLAVKRKKRRRILLWIIIAAVLGAGGYVYYTRYIQNPSEEETLANTSSAKEYVITKSSYAKIIDVSGSVTAYDTQDVVFRSSGAVTGVFVKEGDQVKKGDLLATIDDTSQTYDLVSINYQIEQKTLEGARREVELLELRKTLIETILDYTKVYANFDGTVSQVGIDTGDYVEAGKSVIRIIDVSRLKAAIEIDEMDINSVAVGQKLELEFDALPETVIPASITYIPMEGRLTNQGIGVMDVEITIENPPKGLAPAFTFAGSFQVGDEQDYMIVPSEAVVTLPMGTVLMKKSSDGNITPVKVTTEYAEEGKVRILTGDIAEGDTVISGTQSSRQTNNGLSIRLPGMNSGQRPR